MNLMTASRARCARACRRKHLYRYVLGRRPVEDAAALRFGKLYDAGQEAIWEARRGKRSSEEQLHLGQVKMAALASLSGTDPFDLVRAQVLLTGWHLRWSEEPLEVIAVQPRFECPLVNPLTGAASRTWTLGGKLDVLVRDLRDGLVKILESKSSSEDITSGSDYWKRLRLDGQVSVYFIGMRALGFEPAACIYDVTGKPQQRPSVAKTRAAPETPDEFRERLAGVVSAEPNRWYVRGEVIRLEAEEKDAMFDVWQLAKQLREEENAGVHPRNVDSCVSFGRNCEYLPVCCGEASIDDPALYRQSEPHPELSSGEAVQPAGGAT